MEIKEKSLQGESDGFSYAWAVVRNGEYFLEEA